MKRLPEPKKPARPPDGRWKPGWRSDSRISAKTTAVGDEVVANRGPVKFGDPRHIKPQPRVGFHDLDYIKPARDAIGGPKEGDKLKGYAGPRFPRMLKGQDR